MSPLPSRALLLSVALLGGCASDDAGTEWELVGAYDASATLQAGAIPMAGYVWKPADGMRASCGPSKGPLGMGIFEAEALGNGLTLDQGVGSSKERYVTILVGQAGLYFASAVAFAVLGCMRELPPVPEKVRLVDDSTATSHPEV